MLQIQNEQLSSLAETFSERLEGTNERRVNIFLSYFSSIACWIRLNEQHAPQQVGFYRTYQIKIVEAYI